MKKFLLLLPLTIGLVLLATAQDSTLKKELVGKYKFPDGSVVAEVEVVLENGVLMMNSSAGTSNLDWIKADSFSIAAFNGTAGFRRNDAKKIVGVHIEAGGYVLDGVKDSSTVSHFTFSALRLSPVLRSGTIDCQTDPAAEPALAILSFTKVNRYRNRIL